MKPLKILHTADIHYSSETQKKAVKVLMMLYRETADLLVISGDLFDRAIKNTDASGFSNLIAVIKRLLERFPIVVVQGTPSHDIEGCYYVLEALKERYSFTVIKPGWTYYLNYNKGVHEGIGQNKNMALLIMGMGEPTKTFLHAQQNVSVDQATKTANEVLSGMMLGYGAKRREYPNIPAIFLYHGVVTGSKISETQILPGGGIEMSKDSLSLVGADYYALGHIHLAQQIPGLPAYYAGSAYAINWGELEQKGYNHVSIFPGPLVEIEQKLFPHPPMRKVVVDSIDAIPLKELSGVKTWVVLRVPEEERKIVNEVSILEKLLSAGADIESRVTVETIRKETVRVKGIREAKTLREKVLILGELRDRIPGENILKKVDEIEKSLGTRIESGGGAIRLISLSVRGAKGFKDQSGLDEIFLDFEKLEPGLVALIGENGAGKTTLIENCIPWPRMLTRNKKFSSHFYLPDSHRELVWIEENEGKKYKALIKINAIKDVYEGYIYEWTGTSWEPLPGINGRVAPYEEWCNRLWGSLPLFLRTAFTTQSPTKGKVSGTRVATLEDATKGELKELVTNLLGIEYIQDGSDEAKKSREIWEEKILECEKVIEEIIGKKEEVKNAECDLKVEIERHKKVEINLNETLIEGTELRKCIDDLEIKMQVQNGLTAVMKEKESGMLHIEASIKEDKIKIDCLDESIIYRKKYVNGKKEYDSIYGKLLKEQSDYENKLHEYNGKYKLHVSYSGSLQQHVHDLESVKVQISWHIKEEERQIVNLDKEIENITDRCPKCKQKVPPKMLEILLQEKRTKIECKQNLEESCKLKKDEVDQVSLEIKGINEEIFILIEPKEPLKINIKELEQALKKYDIEDINDKLQDIKTANLRREALVNQGVVSCFQVNTLWSEIEKMKSEIDPEIENVLSRKKEDREVTLSRYNRLSSEKGGIESSIQNLTNQVKKYNKYENEMESLIKEKKDKEKKLSEWTYIEKALGRDGIQALEIDEAGPEITGIANGFLKEVYGDDREVRFETTDMGSDKKQKEVFRIKIYTRNNEGIDGDKGRDLEDLSGGQKRWIVRALEDSFAIVRAKGISGYKFLTRFQDEADDGLDPSAKIKYFKMLQRAAKESGTHQTIIITHSTEVMEMIEQKVEIRDLAI